MYNVIDVCRHIINYSNDKRYGISNLKLQKILYFVQAFFLICKDRPCFREPIEAWDFGPVVPAAYREYKQFGSINIPYIETYFKFESKNLWDVVAMKYVDNVISDNDKKLIDMVVDKFSRYSATALVYLTCRQAPWKNSYSPDRANEIKLDILKGYFAE